MNVIWQEVGKFLGIHFVGMRRCSKYFHSLFDPANNRFMWKRAVRGDSFCLLYYDNHTQTSLELIDFEFKLTSKYRELADQLYRDTCLKNRYEVANWISRRFDIDEGKLRKNLVHAIEQGMMEVLRCTLLSCRNKGFHKQVEIYAFNVALKEQRTTILDWLQKSSAVWDYMSNHKVYMAQFVEACQNGLLDSAKWISKYYYISKLNIQQSHILLLVDLADHIDVFDWIRQKWKL